MIEWLNDLVWVGNVLYPRWFVLAVLLAAATVLFTVSGLIYRMMR